MLFQYRAVQNDKVEVKKIEAASEAEVIEYLKSKGYFIYEVKHVEDVAQSFARTFSDRVTFSDVVDFTRQLAIMLNAGLTITESLAILKQQITKDNLKKVIENIETQIKAGNSMSSALKLYPQYFSSLYIALVKSGEASGKLAEILLKLSENLEKQREFNGKLKGAFIYPGVILTAMFVVMFIMMTFVVPQLLELYKNFNTQLPLSTVILISISGFFSHFWPLIILGVFGGVVFLRRYLKTKAGRLMRDGLALRTPVIKKVIEMSALVDSTRTLSILIGSGVSILEGLNIVTDSTDNLIFQNAFRNVYKQVEKGQSLGAAFQSQGVFPPILIQMAIVGESTGHLDDTLGRLSKYFEFESELAIKSMTTLIEPAILIVLGLGVGALVFSIITPIYNLTSSFK